MEPPETVPPPYVASPLHLLPFRPLMLAPGRIGDASLGRTFARPYRDVATRLSRWRAAGQLIQAEHTALYLHEYTAEGITIRGLVGALDVSTRATVAEKGAVFPHEGIYPGQAAELADRMNDMRLNPAPILLVHRSSAVVRALLDQICRSAPMQVYTDRHGQHHRIWEISEPTRLLALAEGLAPIRALIADGHHRYAAYLMNQERNSDRASGRGLAMLVDQSDTPLFLGAIHRVLHGSTLEELHGAVDALGGRFAEMTSSDAVRELGPGTLVATDSVTWAAISIDVPADRAAVEVLHHDLMAHLPRQPSRIGYHHSVPSALAAACPDQRIAVLLPAPDVDLLLSIVAAGRLLPEKATSFQPKSHLGVFIRSLDDE